MGNIRQSTPPSTLIGASTVPLLQKDSFDEVIFLKGYDVIIENAIECPCKGTSGAPKTTCQNCLGTGWVFLNPTATKAIITSINAQTKYKQWSPELVGTASITVRDEDRIAFMDRITFSTRMSILSETRPVKTAGAQKFIFTSYRCKEIKSIYIFNTDTSKLIKVPSTQYSIKDGNSMIVELTGITYPVNFNGAVSIEYFHNVSYNVVDLTHDFRSTFLINDYGQNKEYNLPMQAVIRRSHLVMGEPTNYSGNNLLDNSD